jgi:hypothetical protein
MEGGAPMEEIFVDAVTGVKWEANCDRCTQDGRNVEISVRPGDIIVFRQVSDLPHGIMEVSGESEKIRKRGEAENSTQMVVELGDGDSKIGPGAANQFPASPDVPVEMTRIEIKDNFEGSLQLQCNLHFSAMKVTLNKY